MSTNALQREPDANVAPIDHGKAGSSGHTVQFYRDDAYLLDGVSRFIGSALGAGDAALVIATQAHRQGLAELLKARGIDISVATHQGRFVALDAGETLSKFMRDGWPDAEQFMQVVGGVLTQTQAAVHREHARIVVFGEMVALLLAEGKIEAAIQLEQLWSDLASSHSFDLHCAYPISGFGKVADGDLITRVCAAHTHAIPSESFMALASEEERLRSIISLQQKAMALETEVAARKRMQESLELLLRDQQKTQDARLKLAAIVESSDDAIASKDLNGIITSWNGSAERMFGYKTEEIIGRPVTLIIPPELQQDEQMILAKLRRGEKIDHFETVRVTKGGERLDVSLTVSPMKDDSGKVIGASKIIRNITETKKMERALVLTEKLASVGRLAATVAHEINNPLEAVTNLLFLAKRDLSDTSKAGRHIELANRELDRITHIARQTLGFYRDTSAPITTSVTQILDELLFLYETKFESRGIKLLRQYRGKTEIMALPGELRQVFSNLISNAIDAMPSGGLLKVRVSESRDWQNLDEHGVRITIADTGSGIQSRHLKRIFEPFFTTKDDVGTGLGLWITRTIVEKHGGALQVRSRTETGGSGTIFSVFFPQTGPPLEGKAPLSSTGKLPVTNAVLTGQEADQ